MKNEKDMIKWLNNLKSDIGQPQYSQLWHYAEILDVIVKYLESTDRTGEWINTWKKIIGGRSYGATCSLCGINGHHGYNYCPNCGAKMKEEEKEK